MNDKNEIILYQPDETVKLEVRMSEETVWLTQQQMATLFGVKENNITYHIRGIYTTNELEPESTTQKIRVVRQEGNRKVTRQIDFYNLDMIISVGYRVNSTNATKFRRWATSVLKEYSARERIVLIDNYVGETVLLRLAEREENVQTKIYTQRTSPSFNVALARHNDQYAPIDLSIFTQSHDRFLLIDQDVYHIGASIKDLGKKWFAFCKMELQADEIMEKLSQI